MDRSEIIARISKLRKEIAILRNQLRSVKCRFCGKIVVRHNIFEKPGTVQAEGRVSCGGTKCESKRKWEKTCLQNDRTKQKMLKIAVRVFPLWKQEYGNRNRWVAGQINDAMKRWHNYEPVGGKWISFHFKKITGRPWSRNYRYIGGR